MSKLEELIKEYCPNGVEYKKLGELGQFYGGLSGKSKNDFTDGNEKFITYKNVYSNPALDLDIEDRVKINKGEKQNSLQYGDIIFTGSSETPDECGFSSVITKETNEKLYLNSFCFFFRMDDPSLLLPDFAKHLFRADSIRYQIGKTASGVTRYNVSKEKMKQVQIPVPALPVQREIVRVLDSFTLYSAELTAELTARRKQYEFYRDKLLTFEHPEIKTYKIKDIAEIYLGLTYTPNYVDNGIKFLSSKNISNDYLDLEDVKYISREEFEKSTPNAKPKRGDVLFTRVGSNLGHPTIVETDEDLCIFVSLGYLRVNEKLVKNKYIKHWMNTEMFWAQVNSKVKNAPKANLNSSWMREFNISIPPIEVQERIVKVLDNFDEICSDLKIGLPAEMGKRQQQYEYYREKLLTFDTKSAIILRQTDRQTGLIRLLQYVYGFVFVELESVLRIKNGKDYKHLGGGEIPVYGSGGIIAQVDTCIYDKPTVLIPRKGSIDKLYYTDKPFWNVDTIFYTEINETFAIAKYVYYCLRKEHLEDYNTAGGVPSLTQAVLNKIVISLPPLEKQKEIVDILDKFDSLCNDISEGLPAEIEARQKQYEFYRDKLLNFKN